MIPTNISTAFSPPIGYGIDKSSEKLPATKVDLEAVTEEVSSMVDSITEELSSMVNGINSTQGPTQGLKMLDIIKLTHFRYEAYGLATKVNNAKLDSVNALIKTIGER